MNYIFIDFNNFLNTCVWRTLKYGGSKSIFFTNGRKFLLMEVLFMEINERRTCNSLDSS